MKLREIYIDAEIVPPKKGDIIKVVPIQFFGISEYPEHINRSQIVTVCGKGPLGLNTGFRRDADYNSHYYNFCKYCNVKLD